jgi:hypothetical protein
MFAKIQIVLAKKLFIALGHLPTGYFGHPGSQRLVVSGKFQAQHRNFMKSRQPTATTQRIDRITLLLAHEPDFLGKKLHFRSSTSL